MAQLNSLLVTGNSRFINPINGDARNGVYFVKGTQTDATGAWTGVIPIPALYDGLTIMYYLPYAGSGNATLNLTLSTGATTGAINCYYSTSRLTTHYAKGCNIVMTYHSAGSISVDGTATTDDRWIANANYDTNSNTIGEYAGSVTAGSGNMARYSLIMQTQLDPPTFASLVTTSSTATTKAKQTCGFIPNGKVLYQSAGTYAVGETAGQSGVWVTASLDLRYSFNITTTTFPATAVGKSIYIKCTLNSTDGKLYLADTTWWATELPTTQDNFYYVFVGQLYGRYQCTLYPLHPIYYYNGTEIEEYSPRIEEIVSDKMDKVNPTGNGYFSLNRKTGTSIGSYSFSEGYNTAAPGSYSHAEGYNTIASGMFSHAEGSQTTASNYSSHTEGINTTASGQYSHAEGYNTTASGDDSHAEGGGTTASGGYSHAEGGGSSASGPSSHAEGSGTQAIGANSHAEGGGSQAKGAQSHAEGYSTAEGNYSHSEGLGTIAASQSQHAGGKYNIGDDDDVYAEIIGNGTSANARSNARTLDWSGNEVLSGTIEATGFGTVLGTEVDRSGIQLTQAEYDALVQAGTVDANTTYFITDRNNAESTYAAGIVYDNTASGLDSTNVQGAIDDIASELSPIGSISSTSWIASTSTAGNTPLTDYLSLDKGTYLVIVAYPVLGNTDLFVSGLVGSNISTYGGPYINLQSQQNTTKIVRADADTQIRVLSMQSFSQSFTYLERGGIFAIRIK